MNKRWMLLLIMALFALLSGCALMDWPIKVTYDIPAKTMKTSLPDVSVAEWVDARKVDDPRFIYYQHLGGLQSGSTSTGRVLSQDVSVVDLLMDVTRKAMEKAGIRVTDSSDFVLSGRILSIDSAVRTGFWRASLDSSMYGEIEISKNGKLLNKTSFVEKGNSDQAPSGTDLYENSLRVMFENLSGTIRDFVESSTQD